MATALMLCLADRVETEQGDPRESLDNSESRKRIISYGNRLFCKPVDGQFRHPWGSKKLYRSYFEDYRTFVSRPMRVAKSISRYGRRKFIIESDLKQFYDQVRPSHLVRALSRFQLNDDEAPFFQFASKVLSWRWSDSSDEQNYTEITGLPRNTRICASTRFGLSWIFRECCDD